MLKVRFGGMVNRWLALALCNAAFLLVFDDRGTTLDFGRVTETRPLRIALHPVPGFKLPHGVHLGILGKADIPLLTAHLTGLDPKARHDRFNGSVGSEEIAAYARRCNDPGVLLIAAVKDNEVIGVAELHPTAFETGEAAFSVSEPWRGRGIGAALFALILEAASSRGLSSLEIATHAGNDAMKHLARKFGAVLTFDHGDSTGRIDLETLGLAATGKVA
jgi:GNAT superfamily N-acetyltransferase